MKLLFDENLSHRLVGQLAAEFPGSTHVRDAGLAAAPDAEVWAYAAANGFVIVSKDTDFQQRALLYGHPPKVIWVRLGNCSTAAVLNERAPGAVQEAFEIFLQLEQQSWKGANGTALLSKDSDATFARRWIAALAANGGASVALLRVNEKPIAAQVLLYSGPMAYTWKTAFDAEFAKFSPGALLIDKVSDALFASGTQTIESCSPAGSFMEHLWTGRRLTVDMLVDVGARRSPGFVMAAVGERAYTFAREFRDRLRAVSWLLPRRKSVAVTRT